MLKEAREGNERSNKGTHGADDPLWYFFDSVDSSVLEDFSGFGDLEVPRKDLSSEVGGTSSSPKLINQFPAPSSDPGRKSSIFLVARRIPEFFLLS